jgi:hypothetical protein
VFEIIHGARKKPSRAATNGNGATAAPKQLR